MGQLFKRYGLDYRTSDPYASNVEFVNGSWIRNSIIALTMNSLHMETVLTISKKLTFLDVLSNTGGIIGLIWPGSVMILAYLLSGLKIKKCEIPGVAPNFGLNDEEKRKILIYLKEIDVVSKSDESFDV